jgi:hypothetical protein
MPMAGANNRAAMTRTNMTRMSFAWSNVLVLRMDDFQAQSFFVVGEVRQKHSRLET